MMKVKFRYLLVGVKGFEPPAPCSQSTCATGLRYTPIMLRYRRRNLLYRNPWELSILFFNFFKSFLFSLL